MTTQTLDQAQAVRNPGGAPGHAPPTNWPDQIFEKLCEADIRQVAYVPDAGHARLIELCHQDNRMKPTVLTTEEEGIGLLAGAWLGGERGVLLMQSSGVGNCINTLSLRQGVQFPAGDDRHHARPMGRGEPLAGADGADHRRQSAARRRGRLRGRHGGNGGAGRRGGVPTSPSTAA